MLFKLLQLSRVLTWNQVPFTLDVSAWFIEQMISMIDLCKRDNST